jgi:myosin heavy subunit
MFANFNQINGRQSAPPPASLQPLLPPQGLIGSFEDKRRENFDRGNAVLEAKRQQLREQEEREKRERDEKDRIEQEKRQRLKEDQDRRRQAEIDKQMERQRLADIQREEERKKLVEQREAARNELIRQQRAEWEKQKKSELESQRLKLHEQLSTLKAKDKNLEYDMQILNEKIQAYKTKIGDSQATLADLNGLLDHTKHTYLIKQTQVEHAEADLNSLTSKLQRLAQERLYLTEQQQQSNLNQDNPFAEEEYHRDSSLLKQKQAAVQATRLDLDAIEAQINATRQRLDSLKIELHGKMRNGDDQSDLLKDTDRLEKLVDFKRASLYGNMNVFPKSESQSTISLNNTSMKYKTQSQSTNNLRANTPKENYDAFKDEIIKIQQSSQQQNNFPALSMSERSRSALPQATTTTTDTTFDPFTSPLTSNTKTNNDWSNAFATSPTLTTTLTNNSDPFASNIDPFGAASTTTLWPNTAKSNGFENADDDDWASLAAVAASKNQTKSVQSPSFKDNLDFFQKSPPPSLSPPSKSTRFDPFTTPLPTPTSTSFVKYKGLFTFEESRD